MNLERLMAMVMRVFLRKVIGRTIDKGLNRLGRGRSAARRERDAVRERRRNRRG